MQIAIIVNVDLMNNSGRCFEVISYWNVCNAVRVNH